MESDLQARAPGGAGALRHTTRQARAASILIVAAASWLCIRGLERGLAHRVPLRVTLGAGFGVWLAAAVASTLVACASLYVCVRGSASFEVPASGRLVRSAFSCLVLGALVYVAFCQPFQVLYFEMYACVWAGLLAAWVVLDRRLLDRLGVRAGRIFDMGLFSVCAALLGLELGLAGLARLRPTPVLAQARKGAQQTLDESRFAPGRIHLGTPVNSKGYYDAEFTPPAPGQKLVVSIADSFGASSVPLEHHFTSVAERRLGNVSIYNIGVGGIGPPEYLHLLLFEVLPLHPDLVVVHIFVGNDIAFDPGAEHESAPWLRSWLDANHVYLVTVPTRWARIARERAEYRHEAAQRGRAPGPTLPRDSGGDMPWLLDPRLEPPTFSKAAFLENQRTHAREVAGGGEEVFGPFFEAMASIQRAAGDTRLLVVLIPEEYQVEDELWAEVEAGLEGVDLERDRAQRRIGAWLAERGIPFIDLLPRLRAVEPLDDGKRHVYLLRDTHFNVRGNRVAGEALAEWIEANLR